MKRPATVNQWRRESAADMALQVLQGHFLLSSNALTFLLQNTYQPSEVIVAAKTVGLPLFSQVADPTALGSLRAALLVFEESSELTPKGVHTAERVAELLVLVNAINDDYYLKSDVVRELRTLKRLLQPGADVHRVLLAHKELLSITFRNEWADGLREPEMEFPIWTGNFW